MLKNQPTLAVVGPGRVGMAVAAQAQKAGYIVSAIVGRDRSKANTAASTLVRPVRICCPSDEDWSADIILLTVADNAIEQTCTDVVRAGACKQCEVLAHCAGALGSDILYEAKQAGCAIGSTHPLQTFPTVEAAIDRMPGTWWFTEGEPLAVERLNGLVAAVGGIARTIASGQKALYHAAAVFASNYLIAVTDMALAAANQAGIERNEMWKALEPLVNATVSNIGSIGTVGALTGPIARGDVNTINRHLSELRNCDSALLDEYRAIGKWTIGIAIKKGTIDRACADTLRALLDQA